MTSCPTENSFNSVSGGAVMNNDNLNVTVFIDSDHVLHHDHELAGTCCLLLQITAFSDDSGNNYTVFGVDINGSPVTETIPGPNGGSVNFTMQISRIDSLTSSDTRTGSITLGAVVSDECSLAD